MDNPSWSVTMLCNCLRVSKSGYYAFLKRAQHPTIECYETELVTLIFEQRRGKAGARVIKMLLWRHFFLLVNLKKVRRIMRDQGLRTKIRRRNKYASFKDKNEVHESVPNYLDRNFDIREAETVFCTDITYLDYNRGKRAYLSVVQDIATKEIVHFNLSQKMTLNLAVDGIKDLYFKIQSKGRKAIMVHSDQGSHYTSRTYRRLLEELDVLQSMSRKGNCLDNAAIESLFGHLKDEMDYRSCHTYEELEKVVKEYVNYYNFERPQWGLKAKTPAECRGFLT